MGWQHETFQDDPEVHTAWTSLSSVPAGKKLAKQKVCDFLDEKGLRPDQVQICHVQVPDRVVYEIVRVYWLAD